MGKGRWGYDLNTTTPDERLSAKDMSFMRGCICIVYRNRMDTVCMHANASMQWFYSIYDKTRACMNMISEAIYA